MRLGLLIEREDVLGLVASTLERDWRVRYGEGVAVSASPLPDSEPLQLIPELSAIVQAPAGSSVRGFLARTNRYTTSRRRALERLLRVTGAAVASGWTRYAQPVLWATVPAADLRELVIVPGNHRIRVFDLSRQRCRVVRKAGFSPEPMKAEVAWRGVMEGPFLRILGHDPGGDWFEEPLIQGNDLHHWPVWRRWQPRLEAALDRLEAWLDATEVPQDVGEHVALLEADVARRTEELQRRYAVTFQGLQNHVGRLAGWANGMGATAFARTHGDLQPGNVVVDRVTGEPVLVDWEFSAMRFRAYDLMVLGLSSRQQTGLADRLWRFVDTGHLAHGVRIPDADDRSWRRATVALLMLEDIARGLGEATNARYRALPSEVARLAVTAGRIAEDLR